MEQEQPLTKKERLCRQEMLIPTPEEKVLTDRCRELMDRFGLDKPAEVAIVMRISLERAEHLLHLARLR